MPNAHHTPDLGAGMLLYFSSIEKMAWPVIFLVHDEKAKCKRPVCRGFGLGFGVEFLSVSTGLSRQAYQLRLSWKGPAHSTGVIALHRCHRIRHTYSEIIALQNGYRIPQNLWIRDTKLILFFPSQQACVFSFQARMAWNHVVPVHYISKMMYQTYLYKGFFIFFMINTVLIKTY